MLLKQGKKDLLEYRVYASRDDMGKAAGNDIADAIVALLKEKEEVNVIFVVKGEGLCWM